jgi:hypothetical protein
MPTIPDGWTVTIEADYYPIPPDMPAGSRSWCVELRHTTARDYLEVPYFTGPAYVGPPDPGDALEDIAGDLRMAEEFTTVREYLDEFGVTDVADYDRACRVVDALAEFRADFLNTFGPTLADDLIDHYENED